MRISDWSSDVCSSDLEDQLRRRHAFIELHEETGHHLFLGHARDMRREEAAMPPILPAADKETRDAQLPTLRRKRKDVGVAQPFGVDRLAALDEGQRFQDRKSTRLNSSH